MARFDTSGIDDIIKDLTEMGEDIGPTADKMLMAGAEEVKKAWKAAAEKHGLRDTGQMIDSIGYPKKPKNIDGIRSIDIYPQGKNRDGVRNAEVAFIQNYGAPHRNIKATHFVDDADKASAEPVQHAMEEIYNEFLREKGM